MEEFITRLVDGLSAGSVYALLALALVVIYRGTGHLNFAQGEMALFSAYLAWFIMGEKDTASTIVVLLAILGAAALSAVGGAVIQTAIVGPMSKRSELAVVVATIGLFLALNASVGYIWDTDPHRFPSLLPNGPEDYFEFLGARVRWERIGILLITLGIAGVLFALFRFTKVGLSMRATATNTESARLVGVRTNRMLMLSWGMAAAIGAVGACLIAPTSSLSPTRMFGVFVYAAAAATFGGLDSPAGAVVAGILIGVIESLASGYVDWIGQDLKQSLALVIILVVLVFRPSGLFGSTRVERV